MRDEHKVRFAMCCMAVCVLAAIGVVLLILQLEGPGYVTGTEIRDRLKNQPEECRPILRARLAKRLVQDTNPLSDADLQAVLGDIDRKTCAIASEQINALTDRSLPTG